MDWISSVVDFVLHVDKHLMTLTQAYGLWTYLILFVIVFCETGLVVTPFLPGDSLLFAAGAIAALGGGVDVAILCLVLVAAAFLGDTVNFHVGKYLGPKVLHKENARFLKREYLDRTHAFFVKYGGLTIIYARFVPIVRTFAPFMAGLGTMSYGRFIVYNATGGAVWVALFVGAGYFFGQLPFIQKNFSLVALAIIILSVVPIAIETIRHRRARKPKIGEFAAPGESPRNDRAKA